MESLSDLSDCSIVSLNQMMQVDFLPVRANRCPALLHSLKVCSTSRIDQHRIDQVVTLEDLVAGCPG